MTVGAKDIPYLRYILPTTCYYQVSAIDFWYYDCEGKKKSMLEPTANVKKKKVTQNLKNIIKKKKNVQLLENIRVR